MALPFIQYTADGNQLVINENTRNIIGSIKKRLVVVSIVGRYRSGKSYLLNRIVEHGQTGNSASTEKSGFEISSAMQSQTKGIWVRCQPHPMNDECCVLFLDTEGFDDVFKNTAPRCDTMILVIALLLCSTLIYNGKNTIDDEDIKKLDFITNIGEYIKFESTMPDEEEDGSQDDDVIFGVFQPSLIWVLRDVTLKHEIDGKPCTADEYLSDRLQPKTMPSGVTTAKKLTKISNYNIPRNQINNMFPEEHRKCFFMPYPVSDLKMLADLNETHSSQLNPTFEKQLEEICNFVYDCKPKTLNIDGQEVILTGKLFAELAANYVTMLQQSENSDKLCLQSSLLAVTELKNMEATEIALNLYRSCYKSCPPLSSCDLKSLHEDAKIEALLQFKKQQVFDKTGQYLKVLQGKLQECFEQFHKTNRKMLEAKFSEVVVECLQQYNDKWDSIALPLPATQLEQIHRDSRTCAIKYFHRFEVLKNEGDFAQDLEADLVKQFELWKNKNELSETKIVSVCNQLVETLIDDYENMLQEGIKGQNLEEARKNSESMVWQTFDTNPMWKKIQYMENEVKSIRKNFKDEIEERFAQVKASIELKKQELEKEENEQKLNVLRKQLRIPVDRNAHQSPITDEVHNHVSSGGGSPDATEDNINFSPRKISKTSTFDILTSGAKKWFKRNSDSKAVLPNEIVQISHQQPKTGISNLAAHSNDRPPVPPKPKTDHHINMYALKKRGFLNYTNGIYETDTYVFFLGREAYLSKDYPAEFVLEGITYNCVTQYEMYKKAMQQKHVSEANAILQETDPYEQMRKGNSLCRFNIQMWKQENRDVVKRATKAKFEQNLPLLLKLKETKNKHLAEASTNLFWGIALTVNTTNIEDMKTWKGKNNHGKILMQVRQELAKFSIPGLV